MNSENCIPCCHLVFLLTFLIAVFIWEATYAGGDEAKPSSTSSKTTVEDSTETRDSSKKNDSDKDSLSQLLFEGFMKTGYRLRYTRKYSDSTEEDQDLKGILSLSLRDREKKPWFGLNLLGNFNIDIDGEPAGGTGPYADVYNSYKGNVKTQLYSAYVETHSSCTKLFAGRQSIYRGESLDFDGLRFEYKYTKNLNLSIYGGIPSNLWESSHAGDHFTGGGLETGIKKIFSLRTDYVHIRDKKTYEPNDPVAKDNLVIVSGKYMRFKPLNVYCLYSTVNGKERRALLRAKWIDKAKRFLASASVLRQNVMLANYSTELSPYYIVLTEYAPYYRYRFLLLKGLSGNVEIETGTDIRKLIDSSDEGMLNHSYEKYYAGVHLKKILDRKINITLMFERWNVYDSNDKTAVEGLIKYTASKSLVLRAGSDFSKYVYDYSFNEEHENVYAAFVRADYKFSVVGSFRFKYSYNRDDREDYHLFECYLILNW